MAKAQQIVPKVFSHVKSVDDFADRILDAWHRAVDGIIEVGMLCVHARETLDRKELNELMKKLHMSLPTFSKLAKIAEDPRITSQENRSKLPSSYGTLYEITQLSNSQFDKALKDGVITPTTERSTVLAMRSTGAGSAKQTKSAPEKARTLVRITTESKSVSKDGMKALQEALAELLRFKSISVEVTPLYQKLTEMPK